MSRGIVPVKVYTPLTPFFYTVGEERGPPAPVRVDPTHPESTRGLRSSPEVSDHFGSPDLGPDLLVLPRVDQGPPVRSRDSRGQDLSVPVPTATNTTWGPHSRTGTVSPPPPVTL